MDVNDLHPADDFSHRFFIWHEWIQVNGPLTTANAFEYFATSMFYDKQSNNQVLRMQTMHTGMPIANEAEELRRFTGIEFALVHAVPPALFVIQKRERLSPDKVRPLAAYFIVNNRIYQSPDLYTVLSNRLLTSLHSLQTSLDTLRAHKPDYTPRAGFLWPISDPSMSDEGGRRRGAGEPSAFDQEPHDRGTPRRQQNSMLLLNAMRTTAAHSSTSFASRALGADQDGAPQDTLAAGATSSAPPPPSSAGIAREQLLTTPSPQEESPTKTSFSAQRKKRKRTLTTPSAS